MKLKLLLSLAAAAPAVLAAHDLLRRSNLAQRHASKTPLLIPRLAAAGNYTLHYFNDKTKEFHVPGNSIPDVDFDAGESYSGLLPISSSPDETRQLFFWFFPSTTGATATDELVIWLNGGPGCSSLNGLLQENGPFLWQSGTFKPLSNPYSWNKAANMLYIEQPVGTGFTKGTANITGEEDLAEQFLGFLEVFLGKFGLEGRETYVTGESYAGAYVPYITDAMYRRNNTALFNPKGLLIYDPLITHEVIQTQIPAVPFVEEMAPIFGLNKTTMDSMRKLHESCGYADYLKRNFVFPPPGPLPEPPQLNMTDECDVWVQIANAARLVNPCFNIYQIQTICPLLWSVLGFPGSFEYLPDGASVYFNRSDVQAAIHVPPTNWAICTARPEDVFPTGDNSPPSALSVLPGLIDRNERTLIVHGSLDYDLIAQGTLLAIQSMTWGDAQGFSEKPGDPFVVPYDDRGTAGVTHTERKLTWVQMDLTGHMVPEYSPAAAYMQLLFLLGRVKSLSE